jgi:hypothetical protein
MIHSAMSQWPELAREIAEALGIPPEKVPSPGTREFLDVMARLEDERPELAARTAAALAVESAPPSPTLSEIRREAVRGRAVGSLFAWATKRDPTQPRRVRVNKTLLLVIGGVIAGGFLISSQLNTARHRMAETARSGQEAQAPSSQLPQTANPPAPSLAPRQGPSQPAQGASRQPGRPQQSQQPQQQTSPPLPNLPLPSMPGPLGGGPSSPPPAAGQGQAQGLAASQISPGQEKPALTVIQAQAAQAQAAPGLTVVAPAQAAQPSGPEGGSSGGAQAQGLTEVTPQRQGERQEQAQPQQGQPAPSQTGGQGASASQPQQPPLPKLSVGDQFDAVLDYAVAASTAWQSVPVVATVVSGPLSGWKVTGSLTLAQDGTPQIAFSQAQSPDGSRTAPVHAVAYNPATGAPGVAGAKTSVMTPQAARTVLAGTLAAVSQYVQAQLQAQQTQVSGLTATLTSQVPPFWQFVASQLASGFQPGPVQAGGTVVVSQLPKGLRVTLLVVQPSP